jgi:transcriptional regulator with XRE-family HTH domain
VDIRQRLACNLKRLRLAKGWSQETFAFNADIHRTYISDLERGARNPTITVLDKLALPLGVTASLLVDDPPEGQGGA